ncbi:MAG: alanine--glyoxylate aminotransferase family protein [Anaerolineae bacterium]|nr:alanine--glyoxylate aminotransferase family protein [Anaerolineae bacterium]
MEIQPVRLMIPGPVDVDDEVLAALSHQVMPHYGRQWLAIYNEVIGCLKQVMRTEHDLLLMPGPGTAALDAAIGSLARTGEPVVVARNGFFGRRLAAIVAGYGLEVRTVEAPAGQPLDPAAVRQALAHTPEAQALVAVHLETSTGVLNPVRDMAQIAAEYDVPFILDAVSSLGGVPLPVDEWGIDVCVTVSNKCLASPPGLAPIAISPRAWQQIEQKGSRAHGWYQDLATWKEYATHWADWHPYPTTLPTNSICALLASLRRILAQGLDAYYDYHAAAARQVRDALLSWGFSMFTSEPYTSPLITAVYGPPGLDLEAYRHYLLEERQIMISGGLDDLHGKIVRVGHIGRAANADYIDAFLQATADYLSLQGLDVAPYRPAA